MSQTNYTKQAKNDSPDAIEDLTLDEVKSKNIKGGALKGDSRVFVADSFSFGVEREMKESGEKGGTEG